MRRMTQLSCHTLVGRVVVKRSSDAVCILIYGGVEAIDLATFGVLATTDAFSHPYSPLRYPPRFPYWGRGLGLSGRVAGAGEERRCCRGHPIKYLIGFRRNHRVAEARIPRAPEWEEKVRVNLRLTSRRQTVHLAEMSRSEMPCPSLGLPPNSTSSSRC